MGTYEIGRIEPEQIDRAYALIRVAHPSVQLSAWRRYAFDAVDKVAVGEPRRAVVVACNGLGYVQGVCITLLHDMADRRVLDVPIFIIVSAADEGGVRTEMLDHLSASATGYGCSALRIWTQGADNWHHHQSPGAVLEAPIDLSISVLRS